MATIKCSKCGAESPSGCKVCLRCGTRFGETKAYPNRGNVMGPQDTLDSKPGRNVSTAANPPQPQVKQAKPRNSPQKILSWIGFVFGVLLSLPYMPSFASFLLLLFALLVLPIAALQDVWKKARIKGAVKGILLVALFFIGIAATPSSSSTDTVDPKAPAEPSQTVSNGETQEDSEANDKSTAESGGNTPFVDASFDTSDYVRMDADVLFEFGGYLSGQKVITVITVESVDTYSVKAKTSNNDGFFFSIVCKFNDKSAVESTEKGDILTIAGTIEEKNPLAEEISFLNTPTANLIDCCIVGLGEIAQELKDGTAQQRELGEQAKQAYEAQIAAANKDEKDSYIEKCETVSYSDVERNPDNYDGKLVKFTGTVIQVSEGWFDSVTMRIDSGGNMWYVTYTRSEGESRILEGDKITCYGECNGVTSYTTILGAQVTIPSMKMKYYN